MNIKQNKNGMHAFAYQGDAATFLAFDIDEPLRKDNFVGFTVLFTNPDGKKFPLSNRIRFEGQPEARFTSSEDAPFQTFNWLHIPGNLKGALNKTPFGIYKYEISPRYINANGKLDAIDPQYTAELYIEVKPFKKGFLDIAFTRGYVVSQAYLERFGNTADLIPANKHPTLEDILNADLSEKMNGTEYSFNDQHQWLGFHAFEKINIFLDEVISNKDISIDVFAYDLNDPEIIKKFLQIASEHRMRIFLDDSATHGPDSVETQFANKFIQTVGEKNSESYIKRGHFGSLSHDKVIIQKESGKAIKILTGSTNFSLNGLFINANHVLIIDEEEVAGKYEEVFDKCFNLKKLLDFKNDDLSLHKSTFKTSKLPKTTITFSPHTTQVAEEILQNVSDIVKSSKSVLFAVMQLQGSGSILDTLKGLSGNPDIISYGISDSSSNIELYKPGVNQGILVTAKPNNHGKVLPPPFNKEVVPNAHEIHHKFIVTDFLSPSAKVFCGSSNLATGSEEKNGDNLIIIEDEDVATVFAIEALRLIDHFEFRNKIMDDKPIWLHTNGDWAKSYFDPNDYHYKRKKLLTGNQ